jgi:hypothetical protein
MEPIRREGGFTNATFLANLFCNGRSRLVLSVVYIALVVSKKIGSSIDLTRHWHGEQNEAIFIVDVAPDQLLVLWLAVQAHRTVRREVPYFN